MRPESLRPVLRAALLSVPAVLVAAAVLQAPEAPRAVLRAAVGLLAAVGCYEVMLYSAGYTTRPEPMIPLMIPLRAPRSSELLRAILTFALLGALLRLLESALRGDRLIALASSAIVAYLLGRSLGPLLAGGGPLRRLMLVPLASALLLLLLSDSDFRYLQSLLRLVEEVVRSAL